MNCKVARKRKIVRTDIINASFEIVREEGFEFFTARRIAKKLQSSTQPIYKEFNGMEEVKESVLKEIQHYLEKEVFQVHQASISLSDVCLNYIRFANEESVFFSSVFMDRTVNILQLHNYSYNIIGKVISDEKEFSHLSDDVIKEVVDILWPFVHGTAVLMAQGKIRFEKEELIKKVYHILNSSLTILDI